jgi:hypothetical protein
MRRRRLKRLPGLKGMAVFKGDGGNPVKTKGIVGEKAKMIFETGFARQEN